MREVWLGLSILVAAPAAGEEWVYGRVLALDWVALPQVQVLLQPSEDNSDCRETWTDAAGLFALRSPEAKGDLLLTARGHGLLASGTWRPGDGPVTLLLKRPGLVRGVVRDETGAPIAGARLFPDHWSYRGMDPPETVTGEDGRFELRERSAGFVDVKVVAPGHEVGRVSTELREGQSRFVEVKLTRAEIVRGTVLDGVTGEPLRDVPFGLYGESTDELGRFEASRPRKAEGQERPRFSLDFSREGFARREVQVPEGPRDPLVVRLWPVAVLHGSVLDPDGRPVAGAVLRFEGTSERSETTDANGRYRFDEVVPGRVENLMISHPPHPTLEPPDFTVAPGARIEQSFSFARGTTAIVRVVADGRPLPGASIRLARRGPTRWQWLRTGPRPVAADGSCVLEGPGASPVWLIASHVGRSPAVRPAPRAGEEAIVSLEPGLAFEGVVKGGEGGTLTLTVQGPPPSNWVNEPRLVKLDETGRFRFEDLPGFPLHLYFRRCGEDYVIEAVLESALTPPFGTRTYDVTTALRTTVHCSRRSR